MFIAITLLVFILLLAWLASKIFTQRQLTWILWGCLISAVGAIAVATLLDEYRAYRKKLEPKPIITVSGQDSEFFVRLEKAFQETRSYYDIVKKLPLNSDKEIYKKYDQRIGDLVLSVRGAIIPDLGNCQLNLQQGAGWIRFFYDRRGPISSNEMSAAGTKEYQDRTEVRYLETYAECVELFKQYRVVDQP